MVEALRDECNISMPDSDRRIGRNLPWRAGFLFHGDRVSDRNDGVRMVSAMARHFSRIETNLLTMLIELVRTPVVSESNHREATRA